MCGASADADAQPLLKGRPDAPARRQCAPLLRLRAALARRNAPTNRLWPDAPRPRRLSWPPGTLPPLLAPSNSLREATHARSWQTPGLRPPMSARARHPHARAPARSLALAAVRGNTKSARRRALPDRPPSNTARASGRRRSRAITRPLKCRPHPARVQARFCRMWPGAAIPCPSWAEFGRIRAAIGQHVQMSTT